jgi:hypothetical protein
MEKTFFSDEAQFNKLGYVTVLQDEEFGVWCVRDITSPVIGPFRFKDIINSERYCEMILHPFIGHLNGNHTARSSFSSVHTARIFMPLLCHVIGKGFI